MSLHGKLVCLNKNGWVNINNLVINVALTIIGAFSRVIKSDGIFLNNMTAAKNIQK